jgi:hypothetical protein
MKICPTHWQMLRDAVTERGMDKLVSRDGREACDRMIQEMEGQAPLFDPLLALNNHFWSEALRCGGLYLMGLNEQAEHYCPICEFERHVKGFDAKVRIGENADAMLEHCRTEGLLPVQQ